MAEDATRYWRRKSEERQEDRARVAQGFKDTAAANVPSGWGADSAEANAPSAPSKSFGFRSGAANPGGVGAQHLGEAAVLGKDLGEPTSFRGGAGAPAPVAIMRGTRTTFQNPAADQGEGGGYVQTPGSSPREFATPEQAGQAWNRGMRNEAVAEGDRRGFTIPEATLDTQYGEYREPGQTGKEITAEAHVAGSEAKNPYYMGLGKKAEAEAAALTGASQKDLIQKNQALIRNKFEAEHGEFNPTTKNYSLPADPNLMSIYKRADTLAKQGVSPEEIEKVITPEIHRHYLTPENVVGAVTLYQQRTNKTVPPETVAALQSGNPKAMGFIYPWIQEYRKQPKPGWFSGTPSVSREETYRQGNRLGERIGQSFTAEAQQAIEDARKLKRGFIGE